VNIAMQEAALIARPKFMAQNSRVDVTNGWQNEQFGKRTTRGDVAAARRT
jgi:hypothetical protein